MENSKEWKFADNDASRSMDIGAKIQARRQIAEQNEITYWKVRSIEMWRVLQQATVFSTTSPAPKENIRYRTRNLFARKQKKNYLRRDFYICTYSSFYSSAHFTSTKSFELNFIGERLIINLDMCMYYRYVC